MCVYSGCPTIGNSFSIHLVSCTQNMSGSSRAMYSRPLFCTQCIKCGWLIIVIIKDGGNDTFIHALIPFTFHELVHGLSTCDQYQLITKLECIPPVFSLSQFNTIPVRLVFLALPFAHSLSISSFCRFDFLHRI